VLTTGGRTERFAMALLPDLPEQAFIQVGDDVGLGLRHGARRGATRATVVAMVGKLAKMAGGATQTHVSRSRVDAAVLEEVAAASGAGPALADAIARANTARHALELADAAGLDGFAACLCRRAAATLAREAGAALQIRAVLVDFEGTARATFPASTEAP
jgi:cobalt-precorrin-5B (C1)-methyltransferase